MKYDNRKKADKLIRSSAAEYLTYVAAAGENGVELRYEDENIWLTQKMLSVLYGVSTSAINQHIKKIYEDKELEEKSTIKNFLIVQIELTKHEMFKDRVQQLIKNMEKTNSNF